MTLAFPSPDFDAAVAAVCHGTATEAGMEALNTLLRGNPRARDEYLFRIELHARLASTPDLFAEEAGTGAAVCPPLLRLEAASSSTVTGSPGPTRRRWRGPVLALAACLALAATGVWLLWFRTPAARHGATSTAVAMLTRTVDARWRAGTGPLRAGGPLEPGWLRLESGLAQVVFYSGARVVIEGPAELQLVSRNEAACLSGRLLAEVPPPARGFRLRTRDLTLVDLGTSFGIDAASGRAEVHVFEGTVEVVPGAATKESLHGGQAVVVDGKGAPRRVASSRAAFTSLFEFQERSLAAEAFRFEQWQFAGARLNDDPALLVRLDFETPGDTDWTLRNLAARDGSLASATVVGCQRGEGRWREKQALEFQSVNDRVRLAVPGDFEALTLSAWLCLKGMDRQFNSLFMSDGFEPGTLHWLIRNDGVLGLTVVGPGPGQSQIIASPRVITPDDFGTWLHLAVVLDGRSGQAVHYVNGEAVSRHPLKLGPPFRLGAAELGNWDARSGPDPAPVLIRNLSGALDEFAAFSRALSPVELRGLYDQGRPEF
jgi:hypothetical protein